MKKIATLLMATMVFVAAQAQSTREEARRVILGGGSENNSTKERDIILGEGTASRERSTTDQINRDYEAKIRSIRNNNNLSASEKQRIIRDLERERDRKLRQANAGQKKHEKKGKAYKSNQGKHKGWTKGKGNKHRHRDGH